MNRRRINCGRFVGIVGAPLEPSLTIEQTHANGDGTVIASFWLCDGEEIEDLQYVVNKLAEARRA